MTELPIDLPSLDRAKAQAKRLRATLAEDGISISHGAALEKVAAQNGFRDWNTLSAAIQRQPQALSYRIGDRVSGRYLGHPFKGSVRSVGAIGSGNRVHVTIEFDHPIDVVAFEGMSAYRKRVNATLRPDGTTVEKTSNGQPHMVLDR